MKYAAAPISFRIPQVDLDRLHALAANVTRLDVERYAAGAKLADVLREVVRRGIDEMERAVYGVDAPEEG